MHTRTLPASPAGSRGASGPVRQKNAGPQGGHCVGAAFQAGRENRAALCAGRPGAPQGRPCVSISRHLSTSWVPGVWPVLLSPRVTGREPPRWLWGCEAA